MNVRTNEDIVHEALLIIYEKYKKEKLVKGILPWAYTILNNVMRRYDTTENRQKGIIDNNIETIRKIYENKVSVEDDTEVKELNEGIRLALNQLNEKNKAIFRFLLKDYSIDEIQKKLGLSRNNLYVRIYRAREKMMHDLEKKDYLI